MYPSRPLYLTWGGQIGSSGAGADIWQCGLHLGITASAAQPDMPNEAAMQAFYEDIVGPYHADSDLKISSGAVLTWAKIVVLTVDGKYATEPLVWNGTPIGGAVGTDFGAPQNSLSVTLWSGQTLGKGNYGRYYVPWLAEPAKRIDGRLSGTMVDEALLRSKEFLDAVNAWTVANTSADGILIFGSTGSGTKKVPTTVRVGDVVDTQRRRRNRIAESYSNVALA